MAPGYAVFKPTDFGNDLEATTCWLTNLHLDFYTYRMSHFFLSEVENGIIKCYVNCRWMCSLMFTGVHNQTQETNIEIFGGGVFTADHAARIRYAHHRPKIGPGF